MTVRARINALAIAVTVAAGLVLSGPSSAEAAGFNCDDYYRLRSDAITACAASGGSSLSVSGWCSSTGHQINTTCNYNES